MNRRDFIKFAGFIAVAGGAISVQSFTPKASRPRMVWVCERIRDGNQWNAFYAKFRYKQIKAEDL